MRIITRILVVGSQRVKTNSFLIDEFTFILNTEWRRNN